MIEAIRSDLYRYISKDYSLKLLLKGLCIPGFRYMFLLRKTANYKKNSLRWFIYRILLRKCALKFGYQIPYNTKIKEGFFIGHFGTIVINDNVTIGRNCNIAHGVTIGQTNRGSNAGVPSIGDFVWIGTNAIIVGKITIGSNVLIAPGAFVNFSIPDHSIVIGNPGKIVSKQNPTEGYICNYLI